MTTSAALTKALVPAYDFDQVTASLKADPGTDLASLLNDLAKIPTPEITKPVAKKTKLAVAEQLNAQMAHSIEALPQVFGKTPLPATRRTLRKNELAAFTDEKEEIVTAKAALTKREEQITRAVSTHFDVVAEREGRASIDKTPVDKNGHYLIGGSGKGTRMEAPVPGREKFFVRERSQDRSELNFEMLFDLYEQGRVSRAEFLYYTKEVRYRVLDGAKFSKGLLSRARRSRTQEIMTMISRVTYGTLSIKLRS
ncbi:hypothetical protein QFZ75_007925 [Streptomyces sp. V3I8]|uniref:hypothetical protein n=1 Tax=Streptomyces sp. V3I8 TaxID=3042279 RepID=UPI002788A8F6|nr:hypothetical protein [Streptomyces sp. V3I8]MDQ1041423.1 hypothetical protein [Streptomyces sp. V3I8]